MKLSISSTAAVVNATCSRTRISRLGDMVELVELVGHIVVVMVGDGPLCGCVLVWMATADTNKGSARRRKRNISCEDRAVS